MMPPHRGEAPGSPRLLGRSEAPPTTECLSTLVSSAASLCTGYQGVTGTLQLDVRGYTRPASTGLRSRDTRTPGISTQECQAGTHWCVRYGLPKTSFQELCTSRHARGPFSRAAIDPPRMNPGVGDPHQPPDIHPRQGYHHDRDPGPCHPGKPRHQSHRSSPRYTPRRPARHAHP